MFPGKGRRQKAEGRSALRRLHVLTSALCLLTSALLPACRQKMSNQPSYRPLEPSVFWSDGMSARPRVAGTVARGELAIGGFMATGKIGAEDGDGFPFPVTPQVMNRGQERFDIYCSPCHGRLADGNGMIPTRGYRHPPSFHTATLRAAKTGHFFDVMTNGFGAMPPYATQVSINDRWAIVAYIRALQLAQNATVDDLTPAESAKLNGAKP